MEGRRDRRNRKEGQRIEGDRRRERWRAGAEQGVSWSSAGREL